MSLTVTVLYYKQDDLSFSLQLHNAVLRDLPVGKGGRVILPDSFRKGKTIMAVLKGEVEVLNTLGERADSYSSRAAG